MGDPASEPPDRLHLLHLAEPLLGPLRFGDVAKDDDPALDRTDLVTERRADHAHVDALRDRAVANEQRNGPRLLSPHRANERQLIGGNGREGIRSEDAERVRPVTWRSLVRSTVDEPLASSVEEQQLPGLVGDRDPIRDTIDDTPQDAGLLSKSLFLSVQLPSAPGHALLQRRGHLLEGEVCVPEAAQRHLEGSQGLCEELPCPKRQTRDRLARVVGRVSRTVGKCLRVDGRQIENALPLRDRRAPEVVCSLEVFLVRESQERGQRLCVSLRERSAVHGDARARYRPLDHLATRPGRYHRAHFFITMVVPWGTFDSMEKSSMSRRAPGRPSPRPCPLEYPSCMACSMSAMPGPLSRAITTMPRRGGSDTSSSVISPRPA